MHVEDPRTQRTDCDSLYDFLPCRTSVSMFPLEFRGQLYWAICRTFPPAQTETLCPLSANPRPLLPSPWDHQLPSALRL